MAISVKEAFNIMLRHKSNLDKYKEELKIYQKNGDTEREDLVKESIKSSEKHIEKNEEIIEKGIDSVKDQKLLKEMFSYPRFSSNFSNKCLNLITSKSFLRKIIRKEKKGKRKYEGQVLISPLQGKAEERLASLPKGIAGAKAFFTNLALQREENKKGSGRG